jgi:DNA-binding transcriptional ArsR family regulator
MSTSPSYSPTRHAAVQAAGALQAQAEQAVQAAALLKVMANPDRLLLLCQMVEGERTVAELGEATGLLQPSLSQQLAVLRREGLVDTRRDGKFIHYRVASPAVLAMLTTLYQQFCQPL